MKTYNRHHCQDRHTTWPGLAACVWPQARIIGDGQYAAVACGARTVTLLATPDQAHARMFDFDRDGCRDRCYRRHKVVALDPDAKPAEPRTPTSPVTRLATTPVTPDSDRPICGRPRTDGKPCQRRPGWGADPGEKHCKDHGGSVKERIAEKERLVESALTFARLSEKARTTALTAEEEQQAEAAARDILRGRGGSADAALGGLVGRLDRPLVAEVPGLDVRWLGLLVALLSRRPGGEGS